METIEDLLVKPKTRVAQSKSSFVIDCLRKRGIEAFFEPTSPDAVRHIQGMIPRGSIVGLGGSVSVTQSGLLDTLRKMPINLLDRYRDGLTPAEMEELRKAAMTADVFIMGCNAVTADGRLVNMDGNGSRVSALIAGPRRVILLAGVNKIVRTLEEGFSRIKNIAAPLNAVRLGHDTPCARTGFCDDPACLPPQRLCSQLTVIEANRASGRITVVLVGEELGF